MIIVFLQYSAPSKHSSPVMHVSFLKIFKKSLNTFNYSVQGTAISLFLLITNDDQLHTLPDWTSTPCCFVQLIFKYGHVMKHETGFVLVNAYGQK